MIDSVPPAQRQGARLRLEPRRSSCTRPGRSTCSSSTRSSRSSPIATSAARSPTRSTALRSSTPRASVPRSPAARSSRRACSTTRRRRPTLAFNVAKAKAELAKSKYPNGLQDLAPDRRRRAEVAHVRPDHPAAAEAARHRRHDPGARPRRLRVGVPEVRLRHVHRLRDQRHQRSRTRWRRSSSTSRTAARRSYWSSYNNPAVTKLVHQAQARVQPAEAGGAVREDPEHSSRRTRRSCRSTTRRTSTRLDEGVQGFAVNPGGAYRLEDVWLT